MGGWLDDRWAKQHMQWAEASEESRENIRFVSAADPNVIQI